MCLILMARDKMEEPDLSLTKPKPEAVSMKLLPILVIILSI